MESEPPAEAERGPAESHDIAMATLADADIEADDLDVMNAADSPVIFKRHRADMEPTLWRRNRKKMTELTSITSEKQAPAAAPMEETVKPTGQETKGSRSALDFLQESWRKTIEGGSFGGGDASGGGAHQPRGQISAEEVVSARERRRKQRRRKRSHTELCSELKRRHGVSACGRWCSNLTTPVRHPPRHPRILEPRCP